MMEVLSCLLAECVPSLGTWRREARSSSCEGFSILMWGRGVKWVSGLLERLGVFFVLQMNMNREFYPK